MDRAVLKSYPFAVLEGMAIGGYAVGADTCIVFVRTEYPLAIRRLEAAIEAARVHGLLGGDVMDTGFEFDIENRKGASAFVPSEGGTKVFSLTAKCAKIELFR